MPIRYARMTSRDRAQASAVLGAFLSADTHYRDSAHDYGDGGAQALERAIDLFIERPELGFVWIASCEDVVAPRIVGACVVCYAISTSRGTLVAKLDDVIIVADWRGRGVGEAMLRALAQELRGAGVTRIDSSCHRDNANAWRFYARLGFRALHEERIAWLL